MPFKNTEALVDDVQLTPKQEQAVRAMMAQGIEQREAKLRAITIAEPPDHFQKVPYVFQAYPRMVYHPDGRHRIANTAEDHRAATAAGWLDNPPKAAGEPETSAPVFEVHPGAALAVEKKRLEEAKRKEKK